MNINPEEIIISIFLFIGWLWFGYYFYLAWRKPDAFIQMAEKSLRLYGNSSGMKEWFHSRPYILLARILMLFAVLTLSFFILGMLWALVQYLWSSILN